MKEKHSFLNTVFIRNNKTYSFLLIFLVFLLVVSIPHINIDGYSQSTITSKFVVFSYGCIALLIISVFSIITSKQINISVSKLDIILFILVVYLSINRYLIQAEYSFSIRYMELLGLSLIYVLIRSLNQKIIFWLLLLIIISGAIQAIYGNLQLLGYYSSNHSGFKLTGSFFNPGPYAGFLISVFPFAFSMYLFKEETVKHVANYRGDKYDLLNNVVKNIFEYIPLLGIICMVLVLPATQSRAAWLAVFSSSLVLLELKYGIIKKIYLKLNILKKSIIGICVLIVISISLLGIYHLKKGSSDGRLFIWKVSTEIIKDYPVFGVGFDRFKAHYMNYQANYFVEHGETEDALVADNSYYAFNELIQFISENGIIALVFLIAILYFIFGMTLIKEDKHIGFITKVSLFGIGLFACFSYPTEILPIKLILVILLAIMAALDRHKIKAYQVSKKSKIPLLKIFVVTVTLVIAVISIKHINNVQNSFKSWKLALNSYQYGDYEGALKEYKIAYHELKNNGEFLMNYGKALSIYKQDEKAIQVLKEAKKHLNTTVIETALGDAYKNLKQYNKAEKAYVHAANMIPARFYPLYLLAKLYESNGEKEKAITKAKTILDKEVKIPSTAIKEIKEEMKNIITNN